MAALPSAPPRWWVALKIPDAAQTRECSKVRVAIRRAGPRRGRIGSLFHLAYALGHDDFNDRADQLWSLIAFTVLVPVVVHGDHGAPVITRLDQLRRTERKTL